MNKGTYVIIITIIVLQAFSMFGIITLSNKFQKLSEELETPIIPLSARALEFEADTETSTTSESQSTTTEEIVSVSPSIFSLFTDLLASISPEGTQEIDTPFSITNDQTADDIIYTLAEDAGYIRQPVATTTLVALQGKLVQPEVKDAWIQLEEKALQEGIRLGIVSGYRSPEAQRSLFLKYFRDETKRDGRKEFTTKEIRSGLADTIIARTLVYAAPPGYSRHHTGYTIDIRDINSGFSFYEFGKTNGYKWISKNNYQNARQFGFIPSYPRGERDGGPEPEPWEFVWVGEDHIQNLSAEILGESHTTTSR